MNDQRPNIFRYHDYREFLKDWLAYRKASQSDFSLRQLAQQADLATGYLPMVLSGKRQLTAGALGKIVSFLGLSQSERGFLEHLLVLGTSESQEARVEALRRMKRTHRFQEVNPEDSEAFEYITNWYLVAIRELAATQAFKADPVWIQSRLRFKVPLKDIKAGLDFLLRRGYLQAKDDGSVQVPQKPLNCSGGVYRIALGKFHREMFVLAAKSIEKTASEDRSIHGHTCALSAGNVEKAKQIVEDAIAKIRSLGENEKVGDSVYHLEMALFPLTKKEESGT